jgi:hypothetical protein
LLFLKKDKREIGAQKNNSNTQKKKSYDTQINWKSTILKKDPKTASLFSVATTFETIFGPPKL